MQALIEGVQLLLVIGMMDMPACHFGYVMHVRDNHIPRVAQDEVGRHARPAQRLDNFGQGVQVTIGNIAGQQALQVTPNLIHRALAACIALEGDDSGQSAVHRWPQAGETLHDLR